VGLSRKMNYTYRMLNDEIAEEIAKKYLGLDTLETQHRDNLDFKEQAIWNIKKALKAAIESGIKRGYEMGLKSRKGI
jgi:hypothetical protein